MKKEDPNVILKKLLTAKKFNPDDIEESMANKHGIYCLWDNHDRAIYIGETTVENENFHKRIRRHISGSISRSHVFSHRSATGPFFQDKNNKHQNPEDVSNVRKVKHKLIRDKCRVTLYPIDESYFEDNDKYSSYVKRLELEVKYIAKIKDVLFHGEILFEKDDINNLVNGNKEILDSLKKQEKIYLNRKC